MTKVSTSHKVAIAVTAVAALTLAGVMTAPVTSARPGAHGRYTVCAIGCTYTTIQTAINAASSGATITIGPGNYSENITISTPVTLKGAGKKTIVYPAVSNPNPLGCSGSLCSGASTIMLVQANSVTIENMKLEGANPRLFPQGTLVNGKFVNARNGIIENFNAGTFTNLTVTKVIVADIYLRGIEAVNQNTSDPFTFTFTHDTVTNVEGDVNLSVSMFNHGGSGSMVNNTVTLASDALSANWSKGTTFKSNLVKNSASGIHTDNQGGTGGSPDLITNNRILGCTKDGLGIYILFPYFSPTVDDNVIRGCYVGLGVYGSQAPGADPVLSKNDVSGSGATTSDPNGTYGAYLTTDMLGFGCANVQATLTGNAFQRSTTGLLVTQTTPTNGDSPCNFQATVSAHNNAIFKTKTTGANGLTGSAFDATNNWWGCSKGPNHNGCASATGTTTFSPWLTKKPPKP
jgi:hypothetical protein